MKTIITTIACFILVVLNANAQDEKPELLKKPASWQFEKFVLPPTFAPGFPYTGVEELRFSPGMFNKDASDYFSYAFVAQLNQTTSITQDALKNYLLTYFRGLCGSTAKQRNLSIDTAQITVSIEKKDRSIYDATLNVFGVFADGAPVILNAEIKVLTHAPAKKTYLLFITSPQRKTHVIWQQLYNIQKEFKIPKE
ncbi:hypothetical protein [Niabella sp.]|uniref:hypothetical protein n=1 Tax=Niabella sp. TaxID=1962976 RepID=UPI00262E583D|nr:hypothetical protein [Niabella sp.]